MKRRSFLQFLGLAPAAAVAPKAVEAAERLSETAKKLDFGADTEELRYDYKYDDECFSAVCSGVDLQDLLRYRR